MAPRVRPEIHSRLSRAWARMDLRVSRAPVKGLGKTGDGGVKGSKGNTTQNVESIKGHGKTGDKGKTGDAEHIPSASGGDILLDRNTGKVNK